MRSFDLRLQAACVVGVVVYFAFAAKTQAAQIEVKPTDKGAAVAVDGQPFAEYLKKHGHQPVIWPIIGPEGQAMTRQFPLGPKLEAEKDDHGHHRSLWFTHGLVNGKDFWLEPRRNGPKEKNNQIVHKEFAALESGETARIVAKNDWTSGGKKVCEDVRKIEFGADEHGRWIDFAVEITATEGPVTFGDTKEGSFAVRVPGTMDVDAKKGGQIVNSRGQKDGDAWGQPAEWVDYHGPVDGKPAGITIFSMPDNFRHPNQWHVRTYGLFAANPFGKKDFPAEESEQGEFKLAKGEKLRLHYRLLFYAGERSPEELAAIYQAYIAKATTASTQH